MNLLGAPFAMLVSMLLLVLGGLGLSEASSVCGQLCLVGDPVNAGMTGIGLIVAGLFSMNAAVTASTADSQPSTSVGAERSALFTYAADTATQGVQAEGSEASPEPAPPDTGPPR